jgi:isopentenyldiphosphate isomerase
MINPQEILFTVDENNVAIEPMARNLAHAHGVWHRCSHIWVVNSKNEILCNQRSFTKDSSPGVWDLYFGGHILAGMEADESALRELEEESGIKASKEDLVFNEICKHESKRSMNREFQYVYVYRWDGRIVDLKLEQEEIRDAKWVPAGELKLIVENDHGGLWAKTPYLENLINEIIHERS